MLVPWRSLNGRHKDTEMCRSGAVKKRRRETETEIRESTERAFEAYGGQLEAVDSFKYLGRVMTAGDDDWPAVRDTVIILEEGNLPHPRCEECDMLVPWRPLRDRHKDTEMCRSGAVKKRRGARGERGRGRRCACTSGEGT